jgi:uncharacterized protein (DUF488 family)
LVTAPPPIFTIGHSTRSIPEFVELLRAGPADLVVDVRTVPRSRRNPQYNEAALPDEFAPYQVGYVRIPGLGGLRGRSRDVPPQVNGHWENQSFHNYADYALSADFSAALGELLDLSAERRVVIMCAEAVWWRCHRRIIADYLIERGRDVRHVMDSDRVEEARLTPGAKAVGGKIHYPAAQGQLIL